MLPVASHLPRVCVCVCVYNNCFHSVSTLLGIFYTFFRLLTSSAAVACSLRGLKHCVLKGALLHTTVVMCAYLRYYHLPVSFSQSSPSPLNSLVNKAFLPAELLLTGCFLFFTPFSANSRDLLYLKMARVVSEILKPPCLASTIIPWSKSLRSHFFPILEFCLKNR